MRVASGDPILLTLDFVPRFGLKGVFWDHSRPAVRQPMVGRAVTTVGCRVDWDGWKKLLYGTTVVAEGPGPRRYLWLCDPTSLAGDLMDRIMFRHVFYVSCAAKGGGRS